MAMTARTSRGAYAVVENVQHVFDGGEAQGGEHRVNHGVEFVVEGGMAPGEL
jgi:hypothetical protein